MLKGMREHGDNLELEYWNYVAGVAGIGPSRLPSRFQGYVKRQVGERKR
jgi:hypothetical protein